MQTLPTRRQGHLIVAGLRVLEHQKGRPASDGELAELLALPEEEVSHFLRGLTRHGVLERVESAFDARYEIVDHTKLDTLPGVEDESALTREVRAFAEKSKSKSKALDAIFAEDPDARSKARSSKLADELKKFQSSQRRSPFASDDGEDDAGEG